MPDQSSPYRQPWEVPREKTEVPDSTEYIKGRLAQGVPKETIEAELLQAGWSREQISEAFQQLQLIVPRSPTGSNQSPPAPQGEPQPAGYTKRIIAYLIDGLIIGFVTSITSGFSGLFINEISVTSIIVSYGIASYIIPTIISIIYFVFFTATTGQTLGKKALGIKVISSDGKKVSWRQSFVRETIGKFISTIIFNLGYLWIFIDHKGKGWHDKISNTWVIDTKLTEKTETRITAVGIIGTIFLGISLGLVLFVLTTGPLAFLIIAGGVGPGSLARLIPLNLIDTLPDIIVPGMIFNLYYSLFVIAGLTPLAIYLANKFRYFIVIIILLYQFILLILVGSLFFATVHAAKIQKQARLEAFESAQQITGIYLPTTLEDDWFGPTIEFNNGIGLVSISYQQKDPSVVSEYSLKVETKVFGDITMKEVKSSKAKLNCDQKTFQELDKENVIKYVKDSSFDKQWLENCEKVKVYGSGSIFTSYKHGENVIDPSYNHFEEFLLVFDKGDTRIFLFYKDYSGVRKGLSKKELIDLSENLRPIELEDSFDFKNY